MATFNISNIFVPALVSAIIRSRLESFPEPPPMLDEYDYIIVGSGPGGSVVANRLSEDPKVTVLLLEAGSQDNETTQVPMMSFVLFKGGYDWNYNTIPNQMGCLGATDTKCSIPAGKVVGGSTALGSMLHSRGYKADFDTWEQEGNTGWSYEELLPYFRKHEDYRLNGSCLEGKYHGCGGELKIRSLLKEVEKNSTEYFIQAGKELGLKELLYEDEDHLGIGRSFFRISEGVRQSAATAFLRPVMKRSNLHIYLDSFVRKVLINPETKSVIGVEFEKKGDIKTVKAKREVIISAGTYASPKILMLSGIGAKEELEKFNIPVISDLPGVGKNLKELVNAMIEASRGSVLPEEDFISTKNIRDWKQGKGYFASSIGLDVHAHVQTKYSVEGSNIPDIFILFRSMGISRTMMPFFKKAFSFNDKMWHDIYEELVDQDIIGLQSFVIHPKSKGKVSLRSADPHDLPIIDGNYYAEEIDRKIQIEGIKYLLQVLNTNVFRESGYKYVSKKLEACSQFDNPSDEYFDCFLSYATLGNWFGCCTNKMGPETDKMAVVDPRLKVYGVKGLRVVDASVLPDQSGAMATTVFMVGEKAAAMIKEDNHLKK